MSWRHLSISGISQLLLTRFLPNFRGRLARSSQVQGKVKATSRQGQDKIKARSRQGQGKVKARARQGQGKVKARSGKGQGKVKERSRKGQGKVKVRSRYLDLRFVWTQFFLDPKFIQNNVKGFDLKAIQSCFYTIFCMFFVQSQIVMHFLSWFLAS